MNAGNGKGSQKRASDLKPTATAWKPSAAAPSRSSESENNRGKVSSVSSGKVPPAENGASSNAPKGPVKPAWGSKSSDAVVKIAPSRPQQQKPVPQKQHQQQQGRIGGQGRWGDNKAGRRNNDQQGGGSNSGSSWVRSASKTGSGGDRESGARNRRQSQSRGSNGPGGDQGNRADSNWSRGKALPVELLEPGEGDSAVKRVSVNDLLDMRLKHLSAPSSWEGEDAMKPPPAVFWDAPTRIAEIEAMAAQPRIGGDVSRNEKRKGGGGGRGGKPNPHDTAPALEDCKPLEINDETRWKAKVMDGKGSTTEDTREDVLKKAMLILNKLSLTKFDKLSDEFINCGVGRDLECLTDAVGLIVKYAHEQQHFSSMYAGLCLKLANTPMEGIDDGPKKGKKFKKILLTRCQTEFETDIPTKIKHATEGITDKAEIEYHANLIKKHYLGHMRFIGELYKGDLISIKIMLFCLPALLKGENEELSNEIDEEKVECFSKLMTVIGSSLERQSEAMKSVGKADAAQSLADCWRIVEVMAGKRKEKGPVVSNRIKFMLQDLLEMRSKGWITRRKEETAKTIAEIHREVAKEERAASRRSSSSANLRGNSKGNIRRGASSGDVRMMDKAQFKPQVDHDGFVSVAPSKSFNRSTSMTAMPRSQPEKPNSGSGRRPSESKFALLNQSDSRRSSNKKGSSNKLVEMDAPSAEEKKAKEERVQKSKAQEEKATVNYLKPDECGNKAKNILKEYFVGGDMNDAVLSIHELVGAGCEGSIARGTKVVESAVLLVMERKVEDVTKFLDVYLRCAKENKIENESFHLGLNDPLEFLSDVAIDAPLAVPHLVKIVAELIQADVVSFNFLLNSPEYFRTDQNAAAFGAKVMKKIGDDVIASEKYIEVIEKLMTEKDKATHDSARDLIEGV